MSCWSLLTNKTQGEGNVKNFIKKYWGILIMFVIVGIGIYLNYKYLALPNRIIESVQSERPSIYIINTRQQIDFFDNCNWVLQYAIDGRVEHAIFGSAKEVEEFMGYLGTLGHLLE